MKILLDENIDVRFKNMFDTKEYQVFTVRDMDWLGIKNGELLILLQKNFFDIFIAVDKNLPYQQNKKTLPVLIIVLDVKRNVLAAVSKLYPKILQILSRPFSKEIIVINEK